MAHFAVPMAGGVLVTLVTLNTRLSPAEIAHIIETGRRYLRAGSVDSLLTGEVQVSVLDSFKPYLHDRLVADVRNATVLHAEIAEQGYAGGYNTLARYLRPLRRVDAAALATLLVRPPPAVRQVTGWITGLPGHLDRADAVRLNAIRARCPELDSAVRQLRVSPG